MSAKSVVPGMPDYIVRLNQIAELALVVTRDSAPGSFERNAQHEINHALVVEIPVMIADSRGRLVDAYEASDVEFALRIFNATVRECERQEGYDGMSLWEPEFKLVLEAARLSSHDGAA